MKNKKMTLILAALMATSMLATGAFAETEADIMPISETEDVVLISETEENEPASLEVAEATHATCDGVIAEAVADEFGQYIVIGEDPMSAQRLNLGEQTVIIKADGTPASAEELTVGTRIRAYHGLASTFSLPPQSAAEVVVILAEETEIPPLYGTVDTVTETENGLEILTADGNFLFFVNNETEIAPYRTRNIVTAADIKAGSKILAWSDVMTMSIPAQAAPTKVMLLPEAVVIEETEEKLSGVVVDGAVFDCEVKEADGAKMLPIRSISEKLGYTVTWNGENRSVLVSGENNALTIVLDDVNVTTTARNAQALAKAPALLDGLTYVTPDFFALLTGDAELVQIND